ncbi:MAG TPA: sirohydrochlorin chelatase [Mycobacterium sp.]
MNLVLVAHGTRKPAGVAMIAGLAERVGSLLNRTVRVTFVDVLGPTPGEILARAAGTGRPAIVMPAFLSRGYHVRADLPAHILASGHPEVIVTPALGPSPQIAELLAAGLAQAGWKPGDSVILAAAGTSDPAARADLHLTTTMLSTLIGQPVELAFAAVGEPGVTDAVAAARRGGTCRVVVASYLLADGLFQQRLRTAGADLVTEPLGTHTRIARLIADRFSQALLPSVDTDGAQGFLATVSRRAESSRALTACAASGTTSRSPARPIHESSPAVNRTRPLST